MPSWQTVCEVLAALPETELDQDSDHPARRVLIRMDPRTFFFTPHWNSSPSVLVWLETVDVELLGELLVDAWRSRAPKRIVREWEGGG